MRTYPAWQKKSGIALCAFALAFVGIELILRLFGFRINTPQETANLPIFRPNASYTNVGVAGRPNEYQVKVKNNSYHFNDVEHTKDKPKDTIRILIIGDSFVNGNQVSLEQTFFRRLEKKLNDQSQTKRYEVISLGDHGAGPLNYWNAMLTPGLSFDPDIILVEFLPENDVTSTVDSLKQKWVAWEKTAIQKTILMSPSTPAWVYKSRFLSLLLYAFDQFRAKETLDAVPLDKRIDPDWFVYCKRPLWHDLWKAAWDTTESAYQGMKEEAKKRDIDFYVVTFTSTFEIDAYNGKNTLPTILSPYDCNGQLPNQRFDALAKKLNLHYLNLNPIFARREQETGKNPHYPFDRHWNEIGHTWTAQEIMKAFGKEMINHKRGAL